MKYEEQVEDWRAMGLDWRGRITSDPSVMLGKPCVAGTRITVQLILEKLAVGATAKDIYLDYPHLEPGSVEAAVAFAVDALYRQWTAQHAEHADEVSH